MQAERTAKELLEEALDEIGEGLDAIPTVTAALAALYLEAGESPHTVVIDAAGYTEEREFQRPCICPPDLLARGGFKGGCPVHAA